MKKHNLFKVLGIILGLIIISSYFLADSAGAISYIGIMDVALRFIQTLYYFFYVLGFLLVLGGFYGVLNKTPAYIKLLDNIAAKVKPFGKKFIFVLILVIAIIASFTGLSFMLVVFVPFVVALIMLLGYDKLVAVGTTIGSIMVGYIGGVFVTFLNSNSGVINTYETFVGLENKFDNVFQKLLLLFAGIALLVIFINTYITGVEKKKIKYDLSDDSELIVNEIDKDYNNIKIWPISLVLLGLFGLIALGFFPWVSMFNLTFFDDFHSILMGLTIGDIIVRLVIALIVFGLVTLIRWIITLIKKKKFKFKVCLPIFISVIVLLGLEILNTLNTYNLYGVSFMEDIMEYLSGTKFFDFAVLPNVISSSYLVAFGQWNASGESLGYLIVCALLLVASLIITMISKAKFDDMVLEFVNGVKKMVPTAILFGMAYTVLIVSYTHGLFDTIVTSYGNFNYGVSSLLLFLGSLLTVDFYYIVVGVFSPVIALISDESVYASVAIMLQGIYGIFSLIGPTSIILIFALTYFDIPYTTWVKFIWRFILSLIILVAFVTALVVLI